MKVDRGVHLMCYVKEACKTSREYIKRCQKNTGQYLRQCLFEEGTLDQFQQASAFNQAVKMRGLIKKNHTLMDMKMPAEAAYVRNGFSNQTALMRSASTNAVFSTRFY